MFGYLTKNIMPIKRQADSAGDHADCTISPFGRDSAPQRAHQRKKYEIAEDTSPMQTSCYPLPRHEPSSALSGGRIKLPDKYPFDIA